MFRRFLFALLFFSVSAVASAEDHAVDRNEDDLFHPSEMALQALAYELSLPVEDKQIYNLAYGLWQSGDLVQSGFYGSPSAKSESTVGENTLYRIYSMTKPVTAVALMILYEEGALGLDDPINLYLPELTALQTCSSKEDGLETICESVAPSPTIRQLLTHTAGFDYSAIEILFKNQKSDVHTKTQLLNYISATPLSSEPGKVWAYSIASDLQGLVVERVSGVPLQDFLSEKVFLPLEMEDTAFCVEASEQNRLVELTAWTSESGIREETGIMARMDCDEHIQVWGGHGLVSSLSDYYKFASFLLTGGGKVKPILSEESRAMITRNQLSSVIPYPRQNSAGAQSGYGFGFGVATVEDPIAGRTALEKGSFYWYGAGGTWFWVDPKNEIIFIGLIQTTTPIETNMMRLSKSLVYADW